MSTPGNTLAHIFSIQTEPKLSLKELAALKMLFDGLGAGMLREKTTFLGMLAGIARKAAIEGIVSFEEFEPEIDVASRSLGLPEETGREIVPYMVGMFPDENNTSWETQPAEYVDTIRTVLQKGGVPDEIGFGLGIALRFIGGSDYRDWQNRTTTDETTLLSQRRLVPDIVRQWNHLPHFTEAQPAVYEGSVLMTPTPVAQRK